jgi:glutathionylspermidine synthase
LVLKPKSINGCLSINLIKSHNKIIKKKIIEYSNTIIVFKSILPVDILLRSYPKVSNTIAPKTCGTNIKKKDKKALIHPL